MVGSGLVGVVRSGLDRVKTGHGWSEFSGFDQSRVRTGRGSYVLSYAARE